MYIEHLTTIFPQKFPYLNVIKKNRAKNNIWKIQHCENNNINRSITLISKVIPLSLLNFLIYDSQSHRGMNDLVQSRNIYFMKKKKRPNYI